jgi:hypothetical protein
MPRSDPTLAYAKLEDERAVIFLALPFLTSLYGECDIDSHQTDKPDGALVVKSTGERIGIEVTTADAQEDLAYLNGEGRKTAEDALRRINRGLSGQPLDLRPQKKDVIVPSAAAIVSRLRQKKERKYVKYREAGFADVILLVTSAHLDAKYADFELIAAEAEYLLSQSRFPYARVIFVCRITQSCQHLYDRVNPRHEAPTGVSSASGITVAHITGVPGLKLNMNAAFDLPPTIPKKA